MQVVKDEQPRFTMIDEYKVRYMELVKKLTKTLS